MNVFEEIKQAIIADPMNEAFTQRGVEPLFRASKDARIALVSQAPGRKTEETNLIWNDPSGDRLRKWMGLSRDVFYDTHSVAHVPMDFYYPGKAKSGDKPPRKGFAEKWHPLLMEEMPNIETIIVVGGYAQKHYLGSRREKNLTETVRQFQQYLPDYLPLVHPSPLNTGWMKKNPWFEAEVIPVLQALIQSNL